MAARLRAGSNQSSVPWALEILSKSLHRPRRARMPVVLDSHPGQPRRQAWVPGCAYKPALRYTLPLARVPHGGYDAQFGNDRQIAGPTMKNVVDYEAGWTKGVINPTTGKESFGGAARNHRIGRLGGADAVYTAGATDALNEIAPLVEQMQDRLQQS
nr:hypothetical protein [Tanacetum cinerariifolium]